LEWFKEMLVAAFILVLSTVALIQFAAFTWRAAFLSVATAELPENASKHLTFNSFEEASAYERLCPEISVGDGSQLGSVSFYHGLLDIITSVGAAVMPAAAGWAEREMALCTRYATVRLAQRMERNQAVAAELASF
jgi:hypothetical protein